MTMIINNCIFNTFDITISRIVKKNTILSVCWAPLPEPEYSGSERLNYENLQHIVKITQLAE